MQTLKIQNLGSAPLSIDLKLAEDRVLRLKLAAGELSADLSSQLSLDELDRSPEMQRLLSSGAASLSIGNGPVFDLRIPMTALVTGTADDVTGPTLTHGMRILDSMLIVATAIGASTVTLRTAPAAGGTALSSALDSGTTGRVADALTSTTAVAAGTTLYARRSDRAVAGELIVRAQRVS